MTRNTNCKSNMKRLKEGVYNLAEANPSLSHNNISRHYGISQQTVIKWLHKRSLDMLRKCETDSLSAKTQQEILATKFTSHPKPIHSPNDFVGKKCRLLYKSSLLAGKVILAQSRNDQKDSPYFLSEIPHFMWKVEDILNDSQMKLEVDE